MIQFTTAEESYHTHGTYELGIKNKKISQHFGLLVYLRTVWSEGFLDKVAPPELKISPIMYFVIQNGTTIFNILDNTTEL